MRFIAQGLLLLAFWLLLSGHYTTWLIASGAVSAFVVAWLLRLANVSDVEGLPIERVIGGVLYWPWLVLEIAKSTLSVTRVILDPRLPISPRLVRAPIGPKTPVGIATYANSITLTPGTLSVEVDRQRGEMVVHALTDATASDLLTGAMDHRVRRFEGSE